MVATNQRDRPADLSSKYSALSRLKDALTSLGGKYAGSETNANKKMDNPVCAYVYSTFGYILYIAAI